MSDDQSDKEDAMSGPTAESVVGLPGEALATILSEAWTNRGWETDVVEDDDGTFLVTGDQGNGQRGLILVLPGDVEVPGKRLQQYASLVEKKSVDVRVVASQGSFTDDAERIANVNDVHLLDPQAVLETVEAEGLEDSLAKYAKQGGSGGGGIAGMLPSLPIPALPIPGGMPSSLPVPPFGGRILKTVLLVGLILVSLIAGFAGGAFLAPGGGGSVAAGGGDIAVASLSTAELKDAGLVVHWNARTAESLTLNGSTYEPPDGTRFLVVQYEVTNSGDERVPVQGNNFLVNANGSRYTPQPLDGVQTFQLTALSTGNTTTGWVVYAIPADASDAVIVPDPDAPGGPVTFVSDPSVPINSSA